VPTGPLRSRNFRLLFACDVTSVTGTAVAQTALPFAVFAIGGSARDLGYITAASMLAFLVFLLIGGTVADRLPRYKVIVAANLMQGTAQATAAALVLTGTARVWELLVLAAVRGIGTGFHMPAASGLLPQTVDADQLARANAIQRIGRNSAMIGGAALGGVLVGLAGAGWGLAVDAASFGVAAMLRIGMRFPPTLPRASTRLVHDLHEGWREVTARRWLWSMVLQSAGVEAISTGALSVLGPEVAEHSLGGARGWGFVLAAYAVGSVVGGIVMIRLPVRRLLIGANIGVLVYALLLFALAVPVPLLPLMAVACLAGGGGEVFNVCWSTTLQQEVPLEALSRVSAYDSLGSYALSPGGAAASGPLAAAFGASAVLAGGGGVVVVLTMAVLALPEVRLMRRRRSFIEMAQPSR
jgi:MFS family permease